MAGVAPSGGAGGISDVLPAHQNGENMGEERFCKNSSCHRPYKHRQNNQLFCSRKCKDAAWGKRRKRNPVLMLEYTHTYRLRHRDEVLRRQRERNGVRGPKYNAQIRSAVLTYLGGKCVTCGFSDWRALQIDHINGGGRKDRRARPSLTAYYKHVMGTPAGTYQLLCSNCNWIKRHENGESFWRTNPYG